MTAMRSLLVVDDDHLIVQTLCDALSLHGWETHSAASAEEAFAITFREHVDCVLMDVRMEDQDGFSALQQIKRRNPLLPVMLMTAFTPEELIADAVRRGTLQDLHATDTARQLAQRLAAAHHVRGHVLALSHDLKLLREVSAHLALEEIDIRLLSWKDDFIAGFESDDHPVTLVTVQSEQQLGFGCLVVTDLDAGVWATLTGCAGHFPRIPHPSINQPDCLLRKPFSIPSLVEQLDAIVVA